MKKKILMIGLLLGSLLEGNTTIELKKGWNLIGIHSDINVKDLGDYKIIWSFKDGKWAAYSPNENILKLIKHTIAREATRGLIFFSIVASTSPFIGLFGTVVSILDTFSTLGDAELGAISVIAQGVSEALVATAIGIFVATFAYSYHQILKRKSYEVVNLLQMQSEAVLTRKDS